MVIHLIGLDTFRSHRRLRQLRQAFRDKFDPHGFNTVTVDGQSATAEELRTAIQTAGFFSPQRFVALDDYVASGAACSPATILEILEPIVKNKETVVVIRELAAETKVKKAVARKGKKTVTAKQTLSIPEAKIETFPLLTPAGLSAWVLKETPERGGSIKKPAVDTLVMLCQNDLWRISSELDKLLSFTGGREVTKSAVESMVRSPFASDIFGLLDAIGQRRSAVAVKLLHQELQSGTHPLALVSTLANHIRTLLMVGGEAGRVAPASMAASLGLHPFVVKKALVQTKLFQPQTLRDWHHQLITIDFQLKSTPLDAETLLDVLLLKESASV